MERLAIQMYTHLQHNIFFCRNLAFTMYLQRLDHSSQDDRLCVKDPQRSLCPWRSEYSRQLYGRKSKKFIHTLAGHSFPSLYASGVSLLLGGDLQTTTELWRKDSRELQRTGPFHLHDAMTYRKIFPTRPKKSGGICLYIKPQAGSVAKLPSPTWSAALCFRSKMSVRDSWSAALYRRCLT